MQLCFASLLPSSPPLLFPLPLSSARQANVWIAIFSFVGNYFWTHYFYRLLGASYTFPSWRLNDVRGGPAPDAQ